jgi:hypothetical protein
MIGIAFVCFLSLHDVQELSTQTPKCCIMVKLFAVQLKTAWEADQLLESATVHVCRMNWLATKRVLGLCLACFFSLQERNLSW